MSEVLKRSKKTDGLPWKKLEWMPMIHKTLRVRPHCTWSGAGEDVGGGEFESPKIDFPYHASTLYLAGTDA